MSRRDAALLLVIIVGIGLTLSSPGCDAEGTACLHKACYPPGASFTFAANVTTVVGGTLEICVAEECASAVWLPPSGDAGMTEDFRKAALDLHEGSISVQSLSATTVQLRIQFPVVPEDPELGLGVSLVAADGGILLDESLHADTHIESGPCGRCQGGWGDVLVQPPQSDAGAADAPGDVPTDSATEDVPGDAHRDFDSGANGG